MRIQNKMMTLFAMAAWLGGLAWAQTPPYTRTVIVPGDQAATVNGQALINAVNGVVGASAADPWLVKVEPGVFDLNGQTLVMKDYVDIEGSGRKMTTITSNVPYTNGPWVLFPATIQAPANVTAELRDLTVVNNSTGSGYGLTGSGDGLCISRTNFEVHTRSGATGLYITGSARFTDVSIHATGENAFGGRILGSYPQVESKVRGLCVKVDGENSATGFELWGKGTIDQLLLTANGGGGTVFGVFLADGPLTLSNSSSTVVGGKGSIATGMYNFYAVSFMRDTTVASNDIGVENNGYFGGGNLLIEGSAVSGTTEAIRSVNADTQVASSRVEGAITVLAGATIVCITCYDGVLSPLNSLCQ